MCYRKWTEEEFKTLIIKYVGLKPVGGWMRNDSSVNKSIEEASKQVAKILSIEWNEEITPGQCYMQIISATIQKKCTKRMMWKLKWILILDLYTPEEFDEWVLKVQPTKGD